MLVLTLLFALVSVAPLASGYFQSVTMAQAPNITRTAVALDNFMVYREAVISYVEKNAAFTGTVVDGSLMLPSGFQKAGPWTNTISSTQIVVYGSSNIGAIGSSTLSNDSMIDGANYFVGYAVSGNWVTTTGGVITAAPNYVPSGAVLSIVNK